MGAKTLLGRKLSWAERRQYVDQAIDRHGETLWRYLLAEGQTVVESGTEWVLIYMALTDYARRQPVPVLSEALLLNLHRRSSKKNDALPARGLEHLREILEELQVIESTGYTPDFVAAGKQVVHAHIAESEALRRHRGPGWTVSAAIVTVLFGVFAIAYGLSERYSHLWHHPVARATAGTSALLPAYENLPVTPVAMYTLPKVSAVSDYRHWVADDQALYAPVLTTPQDSWPTITVKSYALSMNQDSLSNSLEDTASIELVPPMPSPEGSKSSNWHIQSWEVTPVEGWYVACVTWTLNSKTNTSQVLQIYLYNRTTGKFGLIRSLQAQNGVANQYVVATGDHRLVIQPALEETKTHGVLSLPIQVYKLTGTDPYHALQLVTTIPASFGFMENPTVTSSGIVFEGLLGEDSSAAPTTTWYELNFSSSNLVRLPGPPDDNQPHFAVQGPSGALWWGETTPGPVTAGHATYQVSMGQLTDAGDQTTPSVLSGAVSFFNARLGHAYWIQPASSSLDEFVVAKVDN